MNKGFTLIELLVVISIMGILATFIFVNYKSSKSGQDLNKAASDIQSFLRLAQSNATSGVKCGTQGGAFWGVRFETNKKLQLKCGQNIGVGSWQKDLNLEGVQAVYEEVFCSISSPLTVVYAPLDGKVTFSGSDCSKVVINLTATKDNTTKCFTIERGGAVDVQYECTVTE